MTEHKGESLGPRAPFTVPRRSKVVEEGDLKNQSPDGGLAETHRGNSAPQYNRAPAVPTEMYVWEEE